MTKRPSKKESILNAAERMARGGGYHDMSFRRIAGDVGIKSASVFHHFASKEELGAAMARRYTDRFMDGLGDPDEPGLNVADKLARYCNTYRNALHVDRQMCLCGLLGAEIGSLPSDVAKEARRFFDLNIDWLEAALTLPTSDTAKKAKARDRALLVLSALEGAMIVARATGDTTTFDAVSDQLSRVTEKTL